jgi:hypothetical protein
VHPCVSGQKRVEILLEILSQYCSIHHRLVDTKEVAIDKSKEESSIVSQKIGV